jgi:hypothetical protein
LASAALLFLADEQKRVVARSNTAEKTTGSLLVFFMLSPMAPPRKGFFSPFNSQKKDAIL